MVNDKNMDAFEKAEYDGRKTIEAIISGQCVDYEFTKDKYCGVDLLITGNNKTVAMEIKNRTGYTSTDIDNMGGHILEWGKYEALKEYLQKYEKPIYTIIYPNEILMWDISDITDDRFMVEEKKYPNTTKGKNKHKIPKKVCYLKREEAIYNKPNIYNEQRSEEDSGG